jgi:putative oxygen-independent coproporphyrinogen III oxidase
MTPAAADALSSSPAAYVHIPFCARVCPYCDFAVVAGREEVVDRYVAAVVAEIGMSEPWRPLEAVYLGGGTPSRLTPAQLGRILEALERRHGLAPGAEVSIEINPEDFTSDQGAGLVEVGFNRASFGVQSLDPLVLAELGRAHSPSQARDAVATARDAGFDRVSVDLIYGVVGESDESWRESVEVVLASGVDHVSCYALTVEPGTPLGRAVAAGATAPDPDIQADRWEHADRALSTAGLARYEVSNWALPGHECRYNLTVWAQGEYEAYGLGAHGFRHGRRWRNLRHLDTYLDRVETGSEPKAAEETIEGWDAEIDRLFVGLRRTVGVAHGPGSRALAEDAEGARLFGAGVVSDTGDRLVVAKPLLTDAVHRAVLGLADGWEERPRADIVSP